MKLNDYQLAALKFATYTGGLTYTVLGLCGEAGEVAEKVKKRLRGDPVQSTSEDIGRELSDVLWYLAAAADELGYTLEEIADLNLTKLTDRYNRGVLKGNGDDR